MKVHILDDWLGILASLPSFERLAGYETRIWTDHTKDIDVLAQRLADAEVLVLFRERTAITAELLGRLPKLRLISQRGSWPHIDVPACTARKVLVCSQPAKAHPSTATAELSFALMLAAARQLPRQIASLKAGTWQSGVGRSLHGLRLGLYGYGGIARRIAEYARAFEMPVWWWASEEGRARARADGQTLAPSRAAFFGQSDIVSLHVRLIPTTRGLVRADDLLGMGPKAIFVNTARAGLVAPGALEEALAAGRPGTICLDVFAHEPLCDPGDAVLNHPNVIATPHIGFVTEQELDTQFSDIYDQILAFASGQPINMVNPEALTPNDQKAGI